MMNKDVRKTRLATGFSITILIAFWLINIGMANATEDKIAFMSDRAGNLDIWVMDADGSNPVQLTTDSKWDGDPVWSPDGTKIAYASRAGVTFTYENIWVMDADGSNPVQLTTDPAMDTRPAWSPDGTKIAFGSDRDGDPATRDNIWVMDANGDNQVELTTDPAQDVNPAWSPDGTKIAFESYRGGQWDIWVMDADGSNQVKLFDDPSSSGSPAWSPDGTKIAFVSYLAGNFDIWVMDADGSNPVQLTTHHWNDIDPAWSPDGTKIVYASYGDDETWDIWVVDADGSGDPVQLTSGEEYNYAPAWFGEVDSYEDQIEAIEEYFDDAATLGELIGVGATETSAAGKLNAVENMLECAEHLIDIGDFEGACLKLHDAYQKTDGLWPPPDFVTGPAAEELATMIMDLMASLGCE